MSGISSEVVKAWVELRLQEGEFQSAVQTTDEGSIVIMVSPGDRRIEIAAREDRWDFIEPATATARILAVLVDTAIMPPFGLNDTYTLREDLQRVTRFSVNVDVVPADAQQVACVVLNEANGKEILKVIPPTTLPRGAIQCGLLSGDPALEELALVCKEVVWVLEQVAIGGIRGMPDLSI